MERFKSLIEKDFDWSLDPKSLRDTFKRTNFDSIFVNLIAKDVIKILSPQLIAEPHNLVYDDELVHKHLLGPLEKFICGLVEDSSQEDVQIAFDHIQSSNQPSKLCRRILKTGDVSFSCNDCGLDGTCVVCIECFHKSAHKDHNYRMFNSVGGGCCDCGDIEAWKQNYACKDHLNLNQRNLTLSDFEDKQLRSQQIHLDKEEILEKIGRLPKSTATRYFLVCQASLHYARMLLSWNNYNSLPQCLEIESNNDPMLAQLLSKESTSKNYFTVLFNDEVHTYDHVINTLVKIIKCTKMTASIMASTISREGRSLIVNDNYKSCQHVKSQIGNVREGSQGSLKVEIIHGTVLAHQAFAIKLIEWIKKLSSLCDAFRILTAYTLLGTFDSAHSTEQGCSSNGSTLVEIIMLSNTRYWKIARVEWNDLFVTTLLTEYSIKEQFARLLTRNYPTLMHDFIQDDHDHSVSILVMTTQLYTVPSLICMLIEEENALTIISQTLIDTCRNSKRDNPPISFENRNTFDMQGLKRGIYSISDLKHLINFEPTKWTDELRRNVIEAVKIFLNLLSSMQGMDSVKRQTGQHLEYEPDWESGMSLQSRLVMLITRIVTYCSFDDQVLVAVLKETQTRLLKPDGGFKMAVKNLFYHQCSCIQYDVSASPVSVYLPITRFAAALIIELMRRKPCDKIPYDESLVILTEQGESKSKHSMIDIMEPSLRTEVMIAQFRSGMWRRNGYSLVNQISYLHGPSMRKEMFDRDILVLQECAAMCEANEFMMHLLNKFALFNWISNDSLKSSLMSHKSSNHNDEEIMAQTMSLGEEFLQLLLTIVSERYRVGIGLIEEDDVIKNEIIQILCISPSTRSDLTQKLCVNDNELDCIKAVANLKRSAEASTGKYELKNEFYDRFNPFFYHYSRRNQSNALDAQLKRKKNLKESLICCPPPRPVALTKQFSNLNELLRCDITLKLIKKILDRTLGPDDNSSQESSSKTSLKFAASDLQLDQSLHLIGLGLYEQERDPLGFRYIQAAHSEEIFVALKDCYEKAKRSKDLIFWLMKKTNELVDILCTNYSSLLDLHTTGVIQSIRDCFKMALSTCDTMRQDIKQRNSQLAAQRRERIMAMMKNCQDKFLSNPSTKQLVAETERNESHNAGSNVSNYQTFNAQSPSSSSNPANLVSYSMRVGRKTKPPKSISGSSSLADKAPTPGVPPFTSSNNISVKLNNMADELRMDCDADDMMDSKSINMDDDDVLQEPPDISHLCILCRDEQKIGFNQSTMVLLAYIQRSSVLSKNRGERRIPNYALTPSNQLKHQFLTQIRTKQGTSPDMYSFTSDNSWSFDATFMPSDLFFSPHISACGHVMHYDCWQGFCEAIRKRETSRPNRNSRHVSFELEKHEILCPLCECISNATIPLLPNYTRFAHRRTLTGQLNTIFSASPEVIDRTSENLSACLHALRGAVDVFKHIRHIKEVSTNVLINNEDKYIRLLQPKSINDVLEELDETEALSLRDFINSMRSDKISSSNCTKTLLSSISTLAERIHSVGLDLDRSITDVHHARIFMMTSWTISYTIQSYERTARFKGLPLFEDVESSRSLCMSSLLRFSLSSMMTHQSDMMQCHLVRKLRYLLINDEHLSSSPCCLDIDAFEMFVSLFILMQKLYAHIDDSSHVQSSSGSNKSTGNESLLSTSAGSSTSSRISDTQNYAWVTKAVDHEYFRNLLHLVLILNMLQVSITIQNELTEHLSSEAQSDLLSQPEKTKHQSPSETDNLVLQNFYQDIVIASGHPNDNIPTVNDEFSAKVKKRLLPYLRSCAIFFYHLSQIPPPQHLCEKSAFFEGKHFLHPEEEVTDEFIDAEQSFNRSEIKEFDSPADMIAVLEEFDSICHYLDLPNNFSLLLKSQEARHLARAWLRHSRVLVLIKSALKERARNLSSNLSPTLKRASSSSSSLVQSSSSCLQPPPKSSPANQISKTELMPVKFIGQPHSVNCLIDLPYDYSELVDKVSDFICPSIKNEDSKTPTMCLICGVILCSQSYCCQRDLNELASNYQQILQRQQDSRQAVASDEQSSSGGSHPSVGHRASGVRYSAYPPTLAMMSSPAGAAIPLISSTVLDGTGRAASSGASGSGSSLLIHQQLVGSCTYHAHECSGGVGVFLRIRNCQILLLSGRSKGCYMPAPYIDDHGETDFGLMRGNPLHLNRQHYEKLQQMWLTHAIPEQISRTLEYSPYASSINWHLH